MDPDETLNEIRRLSALVRKGMNDGEQIWLNLDALLENVDALDEWLTKGGFVPAAWTTKW